jgi:hypothetical protein
LEGKLLVLNEDTKGSTVIAYDLGADLRANNKKKATLITVFDSSYASECEGATTLSFTSFELVNTNTPGYLKLFLLNETTSIL